MSFIRAKEIPPGSGSWYDCEVETIHESKRAVQKHIRYIGKSARASMSLGRRSIRREPIIKTTYRQGKSKITC